MAILGPLAAFAVSYAALVAAVAARRGAVAAIGVMIAAYAILTWSPRELAESVYALGEWGNARVIVFIFLSLLLAGVMRETGALKDLVDGFSSIGCRFSLAAVPAAIGLIPMPGGALVSAMAMEEKYLKEARLPREWAVYLNYWFRHVWVPSWPLFQSVVITAAVLGVGAVDIVKSTWPATPAAIAAGAVVGLPALLAASCRGGALEPRRLARALWPFILIAVLVFAADLGLLAALALTLAAAFAYYRPRLHQAAKALRLASSPRVHAVLVEALVLKELLIRTGAPQALAAAASSSGLPLPVVVYSIPFVLGLAAGGENFFAATAMPLLKSYLGDQSMLFLAYAGGFIGVMMSPVHLCLVLTVEYYKAPLAKVLAYVAASVAAYTLMIAGLWSIYSTIIT